MGVNNYQTILRIELNDRMCYSEHHLMVPAHFYCWVAGSFNSSCQLGNMAALLNSLFFVFKISFLLKYRVIYYDYIVKWCSGI